MFWRKKKEIDPWQKTLLEAIQKLNEGDLSQLKTVYQAFGCQDKHMIQKASNALYAQISCISRL